MDEKKYNKISFSEIPERSDPFAIKNFIISDKKRPPSNISMSQTYMFDGITFALCIRGSGKIKINFRDYDILPNTVVILLPGQLVNFIEKSDDFLLEGLFFSVDFITDLPLPRDYDILLGMKKDPCVKVSEEVMRDLLESHAFIVKQYHRTNQIFREKIIKAQLVSLIIEIGSIYCMNSVEEVSCSSRQEDLADRFFKLLMVHYKQDRSVSFYAGKLCLTSKYLSTVIKEVTGRSVLAWINETVVAEAKILLKTSELTVMQISEELNFPNPSFFGRFFKQYTGVTPLKYRNN